MKDSEKKLDAVLQQMHDFIDELQERESAYPMVFYHQSEEDISQFVDGGWSLPAEYVYFLRHYVVERVTWATGDYINLNIYGARDLIRGQEGYNYNPVTDEMIEDWPHDYLVIATDEGDPYCLDLSRGDTAVFTALHGTGSWHFSMAYDNLILFLESVLIPPGLEDMLPEESSVAYYELTITGDGKDKLKTLLLLKKLLSYDYSQARRALEQPPLVIYRGVEAGALKLEAELQAIRADFQKRKISLAEFIE
ncbi:SMI1/KNR4 family protein [Lysinibacillus sp. OL1_EC]|uniref:SMI1/KNR4 family protein n=1 Tax=unclassified Lysinibacillus TaxID=2636778 RepID=UPI00103941BF|nr:MULTISPECIES: SMI1/KNR4 family protein [unclassified Lysinibacillus]MCM0624319.1 SMI1/KNR4 family protein [Lysinibacillus sp. OL1_EC]TBV88408.1 SMI1/KNR4 family protein [Lysinibacillus sp. OL1]UKJ44096.1 SMI1/KNR4 family protein [Lysinibacillus sp. ACHW1.5]WGT41154.1 SMI1/KNR4 family protein [Lysinibacillus sp. 1 U-2021]